MKRNISFFYSFKKDKIKRQKLFLKQDAVNIFINYFFFVFFITSLAARNPLR